MLLGQIPKTAEAALPPIYGSLRKVISSECAKMPLDTAGTSAKTSAGKPPKRSSRLSSLAEYSCTGDESHYRVRLQSLFGQIEKEFEALYLENLNCE